MRTIFPLTSLLVAAVAASPAQAQVTLESLQAQVLALQQELATLKANSALKLDGKVSVDTDPNGYPRVLFTGVNVQVNSGNPTVPGTGNVIIGFNEPRWPYADPVCSDGNYWDEATCNARGKVWAADHKSGHDNLIVGKGHAYSAYGSIISGENNAINMRSAVAIGGSLNIVSGQNSIVAGGDRNSARGGSIFGGLQNSTLGGGVVLGGSSNKATGTYSSVTGGSGNAASAQAAHVSGGANNNALGDTASVSGGVGNTASGQFASVSGGERNVATSFAASVSGGFNNRAGDHTLAGASIGPHASICGGKSNLASGESASVSGGLENTASGPYAVVGGGKARKAVGEFDWRAGKLLQDQ